MARRIRVLLVRPNHSEFMDKDEAMLRRHYDVRTLDMYALPKGVSYAPRFLYRLAKGALWADVVLSWFADRHSASAGMLSRMLGAKCIVIVGGYEPAKIPEIGYGALLSERSARNVRKAIGRAHAVLAVSEFTRKELEENLGFHGAKVVHNGIEVGDSSRVPPKERLVLMAANAFSSTRRLKGIDTYAKATSLVPDVRFILVGPYDPEVAGDLRHVSPKLELLGRVKHEELLELMRRATVYCQTSYRESFGIAVAEAMACGCIPVVTRSSAFPEVVGETGFYVEYGDVEGTAKAIVSAMGSGKGQAARERAQHMFAMSRRESQLTSIIDSLASS